MSAVIENHLCYFCDETYPHPSCFIYNYNGIWVCDHCDMIIPIHNMQQNGECCVCIEYKPLIKLPNCVHKVCLECCKTIYFGSTTNVIPIHWRGMIDEQPIWAYTLNDDDDNDPERIKLEEYSLFEETHFDYETKTYDELIVVRNSLITQRLEWMNTDTFINYENKNIRYQLKILNVEKEWDEFNENKIRGNSSCPLCRA